MAKPSARKSTSFPWAHLVAESVTPLFLLDAKRRLVLFNQGCREQTGWSFDDLPQQPCDYVTQADPRSAEAVLAVCAPPAEVLQGAAVEVPAFIPHRTEAPTPGRVRFLPLLDHEQQVVQILGQFLKPDETATSPVPSPAQLLHAELAALRYEIRSRYGQDSVIAHSAPMRRVLSQLSAARHAATCVLFVGEFGTGREHLARVLHQQGPHARLAFVPVDCRRTISSDLKRLIKQVRDDHLELEALRTGTLFLRDISAAPRDVQERIAEWLHAKPGAKAPRVMAADSVSLKELVEQDQFHQDLYYQLTVQVMEVPRLADRPDDILPLAQYFLLEQNRGADRQLTGFDAEAVEALRRYRWPSNVAELKSVVETAGSGSAGPLVTAADFPLAFRSGQDAQRFGPASMPVVRPLETVLEDVEREQIQAALQASRQNLTKAAEMLGLSRPKLYRRLEALGLLPDDSQAPSSSS